MVRASLQPLGGTEFVEAASGLEAIEQLALGPVALIVLDLNMPDMHGIDVLTFVRGHRAHRQVPIMVLTTRGDAASRELAERAGSTAYLTKPFMPQVLATKARELLGPASARQRHSPWSSSKDFSTTTSPSRTSI